MAVLVDEIINNVSRTLLDRVFRTWARSEHVDNLNKALRTMVFLKPDMNPVRAFIPVVAGIAQTLPADGVALIDATDNEVSGRAVSQTDFALLQEENRFWPKGTQQKDVENYSADPRTPRMFYVFPPNDGTGSIRAVYGAVPAALTGSSGESLPVSDSYQNALECFMLAQAYAKNSKKQDLTKTAAFTNDWRTSLGLKAQAQVAVAPKVAQSPGVA